MQKFLSGIIIVVFLASQSLVVIPEGYRGIMLRFNKAVRVAGDEIVINQPGLHFKIPFIDDVRLLDARVQMLDDREDRFLTVEKKDLLVDSYVKWQISDFGKFYTTTGGDFRKAADLLNRKVNDRLRSEIGSRTIKDIVSGSRGELVAEAQKALGTGEDGTDKLGIKVVDVRIKQINLPNEVSSSIYQRMRAEREAVAREHRSQGEEKAQFIRAEVDKKVVVIEANAKKTAETLRGEGDAKAAKIYLDAFGQDPEFYSFLRSLKAYEESFKANQNNVLVVKPDDYFWRYLKTNKAPKSK